MAQTMTRTADEIAILSAYADGPQNMWRTDISKLTDPYVELESIYHCKYGLDCNRDCWSVYPNSIAGRGSKRGEHREKHWHVANYADWIDPYTGETYRWRFRLRPGHSKRRRRQDKERGRKRYRSRTRHRCRHRSRNRSKDYERKREREKDRDRDSSITNRMLVEAYRAGMLSGLRAATKDMKWMVPFHPRVLASASVSASASGQITLPVIPGNPG